MKPSKKSEIAKLAITVGAVLFAGSAMATTDPHSYMFDLAGGSKAVGSDDRWSYTVNNGTGTLNVDVSAWRVEGLSVQNGTHEAGSSNENTEVSEDLRRWSGSGIGVAQTDASHNNGGSTYTHKSPENSPWHAVDNNPENCSANNSNWCDVYGTVQKSYTGEEFLVFDFGPEEVSLHEFEFGWAREADGGSNSRYADATVMSGGNVNALGDLTTNSITNAGFELVNHYSNVQQDQAKAVNTSEYSRYWIVSTLLTSLHPSGFNLHWFDSAKIASISVKTRKPPPPGVPLPATAALFGLGLVLLRKSGAKAAAMAKSDSDYPMT